MNIPHDKIPNAVFSIAHKLEEQGHRAWIVGGCLRDLILERPIHDWDLATTAKPEDVVRIFSRTIPTGMAHGTITVMVDGIGYEVTTLRGEGQYSDGRHPDSVEFVDDITKDLERRDFTVNAMAYELSTSVFTDPFNGREDLRNRVIRAVRDPALRFQEDGLRVLRAARFVAALGFSLDSETALAIRPSLASLAKVSRERVREEWMKTMKAEKPSSAFAIMRAYGILDVVAPPLAFTRAAYFDDALVSVDNARDVMVRHALLLSAIAAGNQQEARSRVDAVLTDLRYSTEEKRLVGVLVEKLKEPPRSMVGRIEARRILRGIGRAYIPAWIELLRASRSDYSANEWHRSYMEEFVTGMVFTVKDLDISGNDIAPLVGGPGPAIASTLAALLDYVETDPARNTREQLLTEAQRIADARAA